MSSSGGMKKIIINSSFVGGISSNISANINIYYCGDGVQNSGETCDSCSQDAAGCGSTGVSSGGGGGGSGGLSCNKKKRYLYKDYNLSKLRTNESFLSLLRKVGYNNITLLINYSQQFAICSESIRYVNRAGDIELNVSYNCTRDLKIIIFDILPELLDINETHLGPSYSNTIYKMNNIYISEFNSYHDVVNVKYVLKTKRFCVYDSRPFILFFPKITVDKEIIIDITNESKIISLRNKSKVENIKREGEIKEKKRAFNFKNIFINFTQPIRKFFIKSLNIWIIFALVVFICLTSLIILSYIEQQYTWIYFSLKQSEFYLDNHNLKKARILLNKTHTRIIKIKRLFPIKTKKYLFLIKLYIFLNDYMNCLVEKKQLDIKKFKREFYKKHLIEEKEIQDIKKTFNLNKILKLYLPTFFFTKGFFTKSYIKQKEVDLYFQLILTYNYLNKKDYENANKIFTKAITTFNEIKKYDNFKKRMRAYDLIDRMFNELRQIFQN
jgi:hypothetical protein